MPSLLVVAMLALALLEGLLSHVRTNNWADSQRWRPTFTLMECPNHWNVLLDVLEVE